MKNARNGDDVVDDEDVDESGENSNDDDDANYGNPDDYSRMELLR
jgi:hypothetical protein